MKCPCGYYYEPEYRRTHQYYLDGGSTTPFIKIDGNLTIDMDSNLGGTHKHQVYIYACPECGTLKMEKY